MKTSTYPYFSLFFVIVFINIYFSVYFITIFLAGAVFILFLDSLKNGYYYLFSLTIIMFLFIESTHGFKLFSLTLISLFLYAFIIPRIRHLFSSPLIGNFMVTFIFYLSFYLYFIVSNHFSLENIHVFIINMVIDGLIVGFLL